MEKKNIKNPQGRRLVGIRSASNTEGLRQHKIIYSPTNYVPMWEETEDKDGQVIYTFRKKIKGQEAVYESFTCTELINFIIEREIKNNICRSGADEEPNPGNDR